MAGSRDCQLCQLQQEMRMIPASYMPTSIKTGLSQILDPLRTLPNNDYRYFAEQNGLTPQIVQWLDSQKTQFNTSSIMAILNYLTERDGDQFTVYQVYKTLCHMKSDGQRIICEGMPEIRSLFHQGTRPGQENSEPASVDLPQQPAPPRERAPSPPPPYDSNVSQHSVYMAGGEGAAGLNDLGCSPQDAANRHAHGGQSNGYHRFDIHEGNGLGANIALPQHMAGRQPGRPVASEATFLPPSDAAWGGYSNGSESSGLQANLPQRLDNLRFGRPEAAENSSSFNNTEDGSVSPPSYVESERQHRSGVQFQPYTAMQELKSPLEGPEVRPGQPPGPRLPRNIPPAGAAGACVCEGRQSSARRPDSFPRYQPASYQQRHALRPVSNNMYCSHSGDCSCHSYSEACGPFSIVSSDLSAEGRPWIEERHRTEVKQPAPSHHHNRNLAPQQPAAPRDNCRPSQPRRQQSAPDIRTNGTTRNSLSCPGLSSKFVFVVAADINETERLDKQVEAFCQELERYRIGHVVVRSTSQTPLVALHPSVMENLPPLLTDFRSVQKFVWSCYKRAAKVLMLVTPGYLRYADGCAEGSLNPETSQQKLMRKIQEKLKEEFCNRNIPLRIWPVLLHQMKANRVHLPFFLSDAVYYWFPLKQGAENVVEVLDEYLCVRSADVKRSI